MDNLSTLASAYIDLISSLKVKTGLDIALKQNDIQVVPLATLERMFDRCHGKTAGTVTVSLYFSGNEASPES